jgi:hypothetical protein
MLFRAQKKPKEKKKKKTKKKKTKKNFAGERFEIFLVSDPGPIYNSEIFGGTPTNTQMYNVRLRL